MAQSDALKKYLDAGMAFTQLTRSKAEQVVKELVAAGELQKNQAKSAIDELVERSRKNADVLAEQVRKEVDSQLSNLGLARKADLERLEEELARLQGTDMPTSGPAEKAGADNEAPAKKAPAKKAPAKKAAAKKAPESGAGKAPVSGGLPGRAEEGAKGESDDNGKSGTPAKKAAKVTKKQG